MPESLRTRLARWGFNLFPAYRGTGARITYIGERYREVRIRVPLSWRTRNYVGTIFGGSLYGAVDPMYMIMLMKNLGEKYRVWVKSAHIDYLKPGTETLYATFSLAPPLLSGIREELATEARTERTFTIQLADAEGVAHATVRQVLHVSRV